MEISIDDKKKRFDRVYAELSQDVFRYVYFRLRDYDHASDITQSVFLKFYEKSESVHMGEEAPYIMTMTKHRVIDFYRTKRSTVSFDETIPRHNPLGFEESPVPQLVGDEDVQFVRQILNELEEEDRDIVLYRAILDWSYEKISTFVGKSEDAVRKRYSRALGRLREIIASKYPAYE